MQTVKSRKIPTFIIFLSSVLLLSYVGFTAFVEPILLQKAKLKLSEVLNESAIAVEFSDVRLKWNGFRIIKLEVERGEDRFESDVSIRLALSPSKPFLRPTLVTFEKPRVLIYRLGSKAQPVATEDDPKIVVSELQSSLSNLLDRYFKAGVSVRFNRANVRVFDNKRDLLLAVPSLTLKLNAKDRSAQIAMTDVQFKQTQLLSQLNGQILMQKQRDHYPFLLQAQDPNGEPWQLKGQISRDLESIDIRHKRRGIPSAWLPTLKIIGNPETVQLLVRLKLDGLMSRDNIDFDIKVASNNLSVQHQSLGKDPLGPWPFSVQSRGAFVPESGSLTVDQGAFFLIGKNKAKPLHISFSGRKSNILAAVNKDPFTIDFHLREGLCSSITETIPQNLLPTLTGLELDGTFSLDGTLKLLSSQEIVRLTPKLNSFNCRVKSSPEYLTRNWLFSGRGEVPDFLAGNPSMRTIKSGRAIPRSLIPDDFFKAVVAAEDAKFWRHEGILIPSLIAAVQANLKAGHVVFGGSTITMQLAKNLYLDRDRVISRKIQEIAIAWVLEQNLSKAEILELYANAIEFGPQTYGISKAAALYFNKSAPDLTSAESLFLASILPSPARNFADSYCQARVSPGLQRRMQNVALGLASLSRERDFMKIYATDLHKFQFQSSLSGCQSLDRIGQSKRNDRKF